MNVVEVSLHSYSLTFALLAVKSSTLALLAYCSVLIATENGVLNTNRSVPLSKNLFEDNSVGVIAFKWLLPWILETSLAFFAFYEEQLLKTFDDHLSPKLKVDYTLISCLSILQWSASSYQVTASGFRKLFTSSILGLQAGWCFAKHGVFLPLDSFTIEMMNLSAISAQSVVLHPSDGIHKLKFSRQGRALKVGCSSRLLYLNLEDKALIERGSIVMNTVTGPGEQDSWIIIYGSGLEYDIWRSPCTKQPNKRLIWDPGPSDNWLKRAMLQQHGIIQNVKLLKQSLASHLPFL